MASSKTAIYRTILAMLRENGLTATDFVVEHLKTQDARIQVSDIKRKEAEDRAFGTTGGTRSV